MGHKYLESSPKNFVEFLREKGIPDIVQYITKSRLSFRKWTSAQSLELLPEIEE